MGGLWFAVMFPMPEQSPTQQAPKKAPTVLKQRYELRDLLGEGGMGRVYRAFDQVLGRAVAVKVLTDVDSPMMAQRFEREAQTLSQLNHPNLASVYDFGVEGTQPFMVMEFIEGKNLAKLIEQGGLDPEKALHVIVQIGEGLAAVHERGVVHRDMKPDNIVISPGKERDRVEIVDFGLAISDAHTRSDDRLTMPGYVVGTQRYMSPEQMEGKPATTASDIYSYGLVCAEILGGPEVIKAGRLRATAPTRPIAHKHWSVIERACREEPGERWASLRSMLEAFHGTVSQSAAKREKTASSRRSSRGAAANRRKKMGLQGLMAAAVVLCFSLIMVLFWRMSANASGTPEITIDKVKASWVSDTELKVTVMGVAQKARPHRMMLEVAVCDAQGNRLTSPDSVLVDRALGSVQLLDILKASQSFDKTFQLKVPSSLQKGYVCATFFDANNEILAQQNSSFWSKR